MLCATAGMVEDADMRSLLLFVSGLALSSCANLVAKKQTYQSSSARVNGAEVALQVKPQGTESGSFMLSAMVYSAAVANLDGPFSWRVEALGQPGVQESLRIHRIRTRTQWSRQEEWYPAEHLGREVSFRKWRGHPEQTRAAFEIPGYLKVKPRVDGPLQIWLDLTITAHGKSERKWLMFRLDPQQKRQDEFIFLPAEIVKGIGTSPEDWDDAGWH
jgi:hypothetical protein